MAGKKKKQKKSEISRKIEKSKDGTIEIVYTIPFRLIKKAREGVAKKLGKDIEIPGFRKGNAPLKKVIEHIPDNTLIEQTLGKILPDLIGKTIKKEKIKPAIYPKFELINAKEGKSWKVKATTCELPKIKLGNYKKNVAGAVRASSIWTPDKAGEDKKAKEPTKEEKQQLAIKALVDNVETVVPQILIDEEINSRLSRLLERIEKLGLSLDQYLSSVGKTAQQLRQEYDKQAKEAIILDLALQEIAEKENIKIDQKQIEDTIKASAGDPKLAKKLNTPEQRQMIEAVLKKRAALEKLISYF